MGIIDDLVNLYVKILLSRRMSFMVKLTNESYILNRTIMVKGAPFVV